MCRTYFHDLSRLAVTARIYSSERWKTVPTLFGNYLLARLWKSSGCIYTIYVSKNEDVCREGQTYFISFLRASFIKKFWAHFHDLCVQTRSCVLRRSEAFRKFSPCEVYKISSGRYITIFACKKEGVCCEVKTYFRSFLRASFMKNLWRHFLDLRIQKSSCLLLGGSDTFWKFSPYEVHEKVLGEFSRFLHPKPNLLAVKFRRISEVLRLQCLQKNSGRIFTIYVPKNKAVGCEVHTHLEILCLQVLPKQFWAQFHDLCVQTWSCLLWVQTHFGSFRFARFMKKVLDTFSQFTRQKMKVFAVKFRHILEVLYQQVLQKKFCAQFHDLCPNIKVFSEKIRRIVEVFARDRPIWIFWGRYRYISHSWADSRFLKNFKSCFLLHYQKYDVFYVLPFLQKLKKSGFMS